MIRFDKPITIDEVLDREPFFFGEIVHGYKVYNALAIIECIIKSEIYNNGPTLNIRMYDIETLKFINHRHIMSQSIVEMKIRSGEYKKIYCDSEEEEAKLRLVIG